MSPPVFQDKQIKRNSRMFSGVKYRVLLPVSALAVLLCCSCSKNETVQEDVRIGFNARLPESSFETRLATDATTFEDTDEIGVYGYLVHDGTHGADGTVGYSVPYIDNNKIKHYANTLWHLNPVRYWPDMGYKAMRFYAYWPYIKNVNTTNTTGLSMFADGNSAPYFKYVSDIKNKAPKEDFLIAQNSGWGNEYVPLNFKRPLAKVVWRIKNKDWIGTNGVDLQFDVYDMASFRYSEEALSQNADVEDDGNGWFDYNATKKTFTHSHDALVAGNAKDSTAGVEMFTCYLIPQEIKELIIKYNYHKEKVTLATPINLQAGHEYIVTLAISKDLVIEVETSEGQDKWYTVTNTNDLTTN